MSRLALINSFRRSAARALRDCSLATVLTNRMALSMFNPALRFQPIDRPASFSSPQQQQQSVLHAAPQHAATSRARLRVHSVSWSSLSFVECARQAWIRRIRMRGRFSHHRTAHPEPSGYGSDPAEVVHAEQEKGDLARAIAGPWYRPNRLWRPHRNCGSPRDNELIPRVRGSHLYVCLVARRRPR